MAEKQIWSPKDARPSVWNVEFFYYDGIFTLHVYVFLFFAEPENRQTTQKRSSTAAQRYCVPMESNTPLQIFEIGTFRVLTLAIFLSITLPTSLSSLKLGIYIYIYVTSGRPRIKIDPGKIRDIANVHKLNIVMRHFYKKKIRS